MNRKNLVSVAALILAAALIFAGCGAAAETSEDDLLQRIATLEQENETLKNQVEVLTAQLESIQSAVLTDWTLKAVASEDRGSAVVSFTAVPATQSEGQTVSLIVTLNGFEAESVQCAPDGERYLATLELPAIDGYSYFCLITSDSGNQQQIPLVTPDNGVNDALVNLSTSLNAYCNLFVESWKVSDSKLIVESGYIQAQMPMISTGGENVTATKAELVFLQNGEELERAAVTLADSEAEGAYEAAVENAEFTLPKLEDDHQLDLVLEVQLSDGSTITFNGCSWYVNSGELNPVMG